MTFLQYAFYFFSAALLFAACMVVGIRNPVKAALFLVLAFFSAACVWITLQAEFLAIVLVLVYVGAVMVLFLFVVMMLDIDLAELRAGFTRYLPVGGLVAALLVAEIALVLARAFSPEDFAPPPPLGREHSNTRELGRLIYTEYAYPFELAALILLAAIVAAIALTMRPRAGGGKRVDPAEQVRARRGRRLRVINMKSESPGKSESAEAERETETPARKS